MVNPGLEQNLRIAKQRLADAKTAPGSPEGKWDKYREASEAVLDAERAIAAAAGDQYAVSLDIPAWETGSPSPHLLQTDNQTILMYILSPDWNELDPKLEGGAVEAAEWIGIVRFEHCICTKMGAPNEEVVRGHPLYGKGFQLYEGMIVENSHWIRELQTINAVHRNYRSERWRDYRHYILSFHDDTFECVARGFTVEKRFASFTTLICEFASQRSF